VRVAEGADGAVVARTQGKGTAPLAGQSQKKTQAESGFVIIATESPIFQQQVCLGQTPAVKRKLCGSSQKPVQNIYPMGWGMCAGWGDGTGGRTCGHLKELLAETPQPLRAETMRNYPLCEMRG